MSKPANLAGGIVRPHRNSLAHGKPPQFAILNHAAIDSGIPRESATQRLGISPPASTGSRFENDVGIAWRAARVASGARRTTYKGSGLTNSASGRSRANIAKAVLISRL